MKTLININFLYFIGILTLPFLFLFGCSTETEFSGVNFNIKGSVVDSKDLAPIEGAIVTFRKLNWSTDDILENPDKVTT
jgi:hypothetical protein